MLLLYHFDTFLATCHCRGFCIKRTCLGYELESTNDAGRAGNGYTAAQYNTLAHCVATWLYSYGLDFERDVVSHASIVVPVGRRHDPWDLDWG